MSSLREESGSCSIGRVPGKEIKPLRGGALRYASPSPLRALFVVAPSWLSGVAGFAPRGSYRSGARVLLHSRTWAGCVAVRVSSMFFRPSGPLLSILHVRGGSFRPSRVCAGAASRRVPSYSWQISAGLALLPSPLSALKRLSLQVVLGAAGLRPFRGRVPVRGPLFRGLVPCTYCYFPISLC